MPFKSEKQRRFLWAKHPEIAKRWAKEYPDQKDLPMYKNDEKKAALTSLGVAIGKFSPTGVNKTLEKNQAKKADSHLASVEMPKADKPTAAGEETSELNEKPEEKVLSSEDKTQNSPVVSTNPEMKKLSVVLSQAVRKAMSTQGQYTPYNVGVSTKPMPPAPVNPPPVGAAPQQAQPQQQQPQNPAAYQGALGGPGAISPSSNPINNYGPISRSGDINGNAAFGVKNSPGSSKNASDFAKKLIQGASVAVPAAVIGATYGYYRNKKKKPDVAPEEHKEEKKSGFDLGLDPVNFVLPAIGAAAGGVRGGLTGPKNKKLLSTLRGAAVGGLTGVGSELGFNAAKNTFGADAGGFGVGAGGGLAALLASKLIPQVKADKKPKKQEEQKEAAADTPCSCGCGDTAKTCKCGPDCSCRKPGGSCYQKEKNAGSPAWQRAEGKNDEGGLNAKGRASYNKATGGNLKAPVTESNPSGERAKRQNSFCSRMCGMKSKETGAKTKADPDSRINKSLRKWNCKCGSAYEFGQMLSGKSAASICSILDNKDTRSEGKQVEDVKPKFQETASKADLNPNDATNKTQKVADSLSAILGGAGGALGGGVLGGGVGGLAGLLQGAYEAEKGKKLHGALRGLRRGIVGGGGVGMGLGAGLGVGAGLGLPRGTAEYFLNNNPLKSPAALAAATQLQLDPDNTKADVGLGAIGGLGIGGTLGVLAAKQDLSAMDEEEKRKKEKQATVDSYAGLSSGGQRWQLGESGINPRIGYKYLGGVVPMPDVSLRFGLPGVGGGIGLDPLPYVFGDSGQPSGRHANLPRSFWKKLQDGFRSPEDAFFLELSRIKDNAPIPEYENFLRSRGVGSSSEEISMLAKILSESTDVKRNAMAKRLPMAVNSVLKHYNPENPKSLFMGKQSSVALDIYYKAAARGDMLREQERQHAQRTHRSLHPAAGATHLGDEFKTPGVGLGRVTKDSTPEHKDRVRAAAEYAKKLRASNKKNDPDRPARFARTADE